MESYGPNDPVDFDNEEIEDIQVTPRRAALDDNDEFIYEDEFIDENGIKKKKPFSKLIIPIIIGLVIALILGVLYFTLGAKKDNAPTSSVSPTASELVESAKPTPSPTESSSPEPTNTASTEPETKEPVESAKPSESAKTEESTEAPTETNSPLATSEEPTESGPAKPTETASNVPEPSVSNEQTAPTTLKYDFYNSEPEDSSAMCMDMLGKPSEVFAKTTDGVTTAENEDFWVAQREKSDGDEAAYLACIAKSSEGAGVGVVVLYSPLESSHSKYDFTSGFEQQGLTSKREVSDNYSVTFAWPKENNFDDGKVTSYITETLKKVK